ncbi:MAG: hypothetical protein H0X39_00445 [Actinobacteria bacterium]|nr:hypothetical protein [Actinomycetota bacterium]
MLEVPPSLPAGPLVTFRDTIRQIVPAWLRGPIGGRLLYAVAAPIDAMADALVAGVRSRFPGAVSSETLGIIGRERRIRRGRTENDATYTPRVISWLDSHRLRGGPYEMLRQLFAHYAPNNFKIDLVYRSGRRFQMDTAGNITRDSLGLFTYAEWANWTLYFYWPSPVLKRSWGASGSTWGDGFVWGSTLTTQEAVDMRLLPKEWNAAHCKGRIVLLQSGTRLWGYPLRTWGTVGSNWGTAAPNIQLSIG